MKCSKCGKKIIIKQVAGYKHARVNEFPIMFNPDKAGTMEFITLNGIRKHGNLESSINEESGYLVLECKEEA